MNWGVAYTTRINSSTSFQLRNAWIPPLVAQAPMLEGLLEVPDGARTSDLERLRKGPTDDGLWQGDGGSPRPG